jgi:hypothetical protein
LGLGRLNQEDCKFKISLGYILKPYLKRERERERGKKKKKRMDFPQKFLKQTIAFKTYDQNMGIWMSNKHCFIMMLGQLEGH